MAKKVLAPVNLDVQNCSPVFPNTTVNWSPTPEAVVQHTTPPLACQSRAPINVTSPEDEDEVLNESIVLECVD